MKVYTNTRLLQSKQRLGFWATLIGVSLMIGAIFMSQNPAQIFIAWGLSLAGLVIAIFGTYNINRWVRPPVPHVVLQQALDKLDSKHLLFNHTSTVPHVLLTPRGLIGIRGKRYEGPTHFNSETGKWSGRFSFWRLYSSGLTAEQVGNPTKDVQKVEADLRTWVQTHLPRGGETIPVEGVAFFVSPKMELQGNKPPVPVALPDTVKKVVQELLNDHPLLPYALYEQVKSALEKEAGEAGAEIIAAPVRKAKNNRLREDRKRR